MEVNYKVIKPLLTLIVELVIKWEQIFGNTKEGLDKKKEVWTETLGLIYDVADAVMNLSDVMDDWIKSVLIPQAIDKVVAFFNIEGGFDPSIKDSVVDFIAKDFPEIVKLPS